MTITVKDFTLKFDFKRAADQQFNIDVQGNDFNDIKSQVTEFADKVKETLQAKDVSVKLGKYSFFSVQDLFKAPNPNEGEEEGNGFGNGNNNAYQSKYE